MEKDPKKRPSLKEQTYDVGIGTGASANIHGKEYFPVRHPEVNIFLSGLLHGILPVSSTVAMSDMQTHETLALSEGFHDSPGDRDELRASAIILRYIFG